MEFVPLHPGRAQLQSLAVSGLQQVQHCGVAGHSDHGAHLAHLEAGLGHGDGGEVSEAVGGSEDCQCVSGENDVIWIVGGLEVSESILVH